ncbi:hypothetical protein sS8_2180 [Methylocaldum marinum]|uniref:Uncharacterized protein n=1 Tax=Methylocaldum marinum TaxID=1432792 RepID=A0A250KRF4_9GAMM|nr:hypothetical protein sS8_2180 [Methylocaldum marinum]
MAEGQGRHPDPGRGRLDQLAPGPAAMPGHENPLDKEGASDHDEATQYTNQGYYRNNHVPGAHQSATLSVTS